MAKRKTKLNDLHQSLQLIANKLSDEEYVLVAGTMFQLMMGEKFGYVGALDGRLFDDIKTIQKVQKQKKIKHRAKILKFKVIKGSKEV